MWRVFDLMTRIECFVTKRFGRGAGNGRSPPAAATVRPNADKRLRPQCYHSRHPGAATAAHLAMCINVSHGAEVEQPARASLDVERRASNMRAVSAWPL